MVRASALWLLMLNVRAGWPGFKGESGFTSNAPPALPVCRRLFGRRVLLGTGPGHPNVIMTTVSLGVIEVPLLFASLIREDIRRPMRVVHKDLDIENPSSESNVPSVTEGPLGAGVTTELSEFLTRVPRTELTPMMLDMIEQGLSHTMLITADPPSKTVKKAIAVWRHGDDGSWILRFSDAFMLLMQRRNFHDVTAKDLCIAAPASGGPEVPVP